MAAAIGIIMLYTGIFFTVIAGVFVFTPSTSSAGIAGVVSAGTVALLGLVTICASNVISWRKPSPRRPAVIRMPPACAVVYDAGWYEQVEPAAAPPAAPPAQVKAAPAPEVKATPEPTPPVVEPSRFSLLDLD